MYDASAKIPSGILSGNVNQFGDFDQCLNANDEKSGIKGQYCLAFVELSLPPNADEKLKYILDLVHSHSAFRSRLEDVSVYQRKINTFKFMRALRSMYVIRFQCVSNKMKCLRIMLNFCVLVYGEKSTRTAVCCNRTFFFFL